MIEIRINPSFRPNERLVVPITEPSSDGSYLYFYQVDRNGVKMEDIEFDSTFRGTRTNLCELVEKGVLLVLHNGTPLTPEQIRDFSA